MLKLLISIYEQYITIVKNKGEMVQRSKVHNRPGRAHELIWSYGFVSLTFAARARPHYSHNLKKGKQIYVRFYFNYNRNHIYIIINQRLKDL